MNKWMLAYAIFVIVLGVLMFIYGGYDDSPGGQLLGLVAVIFGTIRLVRNKRRGSA